MTLSRAMAEAVTPEAAGRLAVLASFFFDPPGVLFIEVLVLSFGLPGAIFVEALVLFFKIVPFGDLGAGLFFDDLVFVDILPDLSLECCLGPGLLAGLVRSVGCFLLAFSSGLLLGCALSGVFP